MAVRTAINYIAEFVRDELGIASRLPADVTSGSTEMRVMRPEIFDPSGGTVMVGDSFITYTHIDGDELAGIPSSGDGSIASTLQDANDSSAALIYIPQLVTELELENILDDRRLWMDAVKLKEDRTKKKYKAPPWLGLLSESEIEIRDDNAKSGFSTVTPDDIDERNGQISFDSARDESALYIAGWRYNPWAVCGEVLQRIARDEARFSYLQVGQFAGSRKDTFALAKQYWRRSAVLERWK